MYVGYFTNRKIHIKAHFKWKLLENHKTQRIVKLLCLRKAMISFFKNLC